MYWYWYFTLLLFNRWHCLSYIHLQNFCMIKKNDFNEKLFFLSILDATVTCTLFTKYLIDHWFMVKLLSIWSLKKFLIINSNKHIHVHVLYLSILLFLWNVNYICNLWIKKKLYLHLNKLESPSPKDALCQVWLKLAQWFLEKKIFKFHQCIFTIL